MEYWIVSHCRSIRTIAVGAIALYALVQQVLMRRLRQFRKTPEASVYINGFDFRPESYETP